MADNMAQPERVSKRRRIQGRRDTGPSFHEDRVTIVVADGLRYVQPYR